MRFFIILAIIVIIWVVRYFWENREVREEQRKLEKTISKGLQLRCRSEMLDVGESEPVPIYSVVVSGTVYVPRDNTPAELVMRLVDVTEDEAMPVICTYDEFADEDGCFEVKQSMTVPYQISTIEDMTMPPIPKDALVLAKRGKRMIEIVVGIVDAHNEDYVHSSGVRRINLEQKFYGFLEKADHDIHLDRAFGRLALAICASDGLIHERETQVLKQYFNERVAGTEDAKIKAERKKTLNQVLREALADTKQKKNSQSTNLQAICKEIKVLESEAINQEAYELAVRIVAADDVVEDEELEVLKKVSGYLGIPPELDQELRDRHLRVHMFKASNVEAMIDVPIGLSIEDEKDRLNREYQKWRGRIHHRDPKIKEEATSRIEEITRRRRELGEMEHDVDVDRAFGRLAVAIIACDGHIDEREKRLLKQYFKERVATTQSAERKTERRITLNSVLKVAMENTKSKHKSEATDLKSICREIKSNDSDELDKEAYELVVRLVIADDIVNDEELKMLKAVAGYLEISPDLDNELRQRYRVNQMTQRD